MGGPGRGALGSRGENARPCRCPPGARRTRKEERGTGRWKVAGQDRRVGGGQPDGIPEVEGAEGPEVKEALSR